VVIFYLGCYFETKNMITVVLTKTTKRLKVIQVNNLNKQNIQIIL